MYVCRYVGMYACMHVGRYVCMHVCMYACMHVSMYLCIYLCILRIPTRIEAWLRQRGTTWYQYCQSLG